MRTFSSGEMAVREPVWEAISRLWLDTVIDNRDREMIAQTLAATPLSDDELDRIYRYEVAPVVHGNLKIVAGAWGGFDEEWLRASITRHVARSGRLFRWWADSRPGRWWMHADTDADWREVMRLVRRTRGS